MAIQRELWSKEYVLASALYAGEVLPTLTNYNADSDKAEKYHITVIPTSSANYRQFGDASETVTFTDGTPEDKELELRDEAFTAFYVSDEVVDTTNVKVIEGKMKQAYKANLKKIEEKVLLDMAINCDSGNMIELASGNELTFEVLQTMRKNLIDGGSDMSNAYLVLNSTFEVRLQNVTDNDGNRIFIKESTYPKGVLEKGVIGTVLGFKVRLSHSLPTLSDDGTAYDAAGETALVYYDADAMAVYVDKNPKIDTERDIDVRPVKNKVVIGNYHGKQMVFPALAGHVREYSL